MLTEDVPVAQRVSREAMFRVANSYFDALEGDSGKIGAFADDCVRHENGYQTVNNPPPGGRMMPGPQLPDPKQNGKRKRSPDFYVLRSTFFVPTERPAAPPL